MMEEIIKWFFVGLTLIGYFLNANKIKWCFPIWIICSIGWIIINTINKEYALVGNFFVYFCFEIYGFIKWNKDEKIMRNK